MSNISFTKKITFMFIFLFIVIVYFVYAFVLNKYTELENTTSIKISTEITNVLSGLVHNLQLERGYSSGYITKKLNKSKSDLLNQQGRTDASYVELIDFINLKSHENNTKYKNASYKIEQIIKEIKIELSKIEKIRNDVLNLEIDFKAEVKYYSDINENILKAIKIINNHFINKNSYSRTIESLENIKENAGLERAYVYNLILSGNYDSLLVRKIDFFQKNQLKYKEEFFSITTQQAKNIYMNNNNMQKDIDLLREKFKKLELSPKDATRWFEVSTNNINNKENILQKIFELHLKTADRKHKSANSILYSVLLLSIGLCIALILILYYFKKLSKEEEKIKNDLRFAGYAFNSHEAMTITDINGMIIKVNKAFSRITGYSAEEAVGVNPSILKSKEHEPSFYVNMWETILRDGMWSGEIYNRRKNGDVYPEILSITAIKNKFGKTTHYIAQFLDITELKNAQQEAIHQANHDFLTGIMNRKAITDRLEEEYSKAKRHNILEAFLFIDLDNFKAVNDTYGHKAGDFVLVEFTSRLKSILRKEDIIARLSGDEFAVIISNSDNDKDKLTLMVKEVCSKLLKVVTQDFIYENNNMNIGASIGVSIFPENQKDIDEVVLQGDIAMYKAKDNGKNQVEFFTP